MFLYIKLSQSLGCGEMVVIDFFTITALIGMIDV